MGQVFQTFGVVFEAAADVDALKGFVVGLVCGAEVAWQAFLGVVEFGQGGGEMGFAGEQDVLGAAGQVSPLLLGQLGQREGVPAQGVGVAETTFQLVPQTALTQAQCIRNERSAKQQMGAS